MLLVEKFFKSFTKKELCDAKESTEVLISIAESSEKVGEMGKKAVEAGGLIYLDPQDHGLIYSHSFADLDRHQREVINLEESVTPKN